MYICIFFLIEHCLPLEKNPILYNNFLRIMGWTIDASYFNFLPCRFLDEEDPYENFSVFKEPAVSAQKCPETIKMQIVNDQTGLTYFNF